MFGAYVKENRKALIALAVYTAVFALVFWLYRLPLGAAGYAPLNVSVITDEKWLLFVIEQVLSNALKYTRSGSVSITLEAPKTLCIRDTGIGIAPEDLPRVFEKGYTGSNGRTDKRATGIGLYLCRRILAKLGHSITIASTPGMGTTVRIGLEQDALEVE